MAHRSLSAARAKYEYMTRWTNALSTYVENTLITKQNGHYFSLCLMVGISQCPPTRPGITLCASGLGFIVVVSRCRCEPLRAGCCGGEGVLGVS